jgi:hypothetical protein
VDEFNQANFATPPLASPAAPRDRRAAIGVMIFVLILGGVFRWLEFPGRYELRDVDETGYLAGGPQLIEGIAPGYKAAPGGPQFWAEWAYVAVDAARRMVEPGPRESAVPLQVRPFIALDDALFHTYRDLSRMHQYFVGLNVGLALLGCCAAAGLGICYGGWAGGLLVGGLFAIWPLFIEYSEESRPYAAAWAFGMIAMWLAALPQRNARLWSAAVCLGLAIGSRIDILNLLPLLWWIYLDRQPPTQSVVRRVRRLVLASLLAGAVAVFVSPWLMTSLVGELRAIATVRFNPTPSGHVPWTSTLAEFGFNKGAALATILALAAVCMQPRGRMLRTLVLAFFWALLFASMLKERGFGLHQHAEVFLALLVLLAASLPALLSRFPRIGIVAVILALALPTTLSATSIPHIRAAYQGDDVVPWVEQHIPAGTVVYIYGSPWLMPSLLPTPQSSQAIWSEVTDDQAWRKKFQAGLARFGLTADELPRALSEENLVQERGNSRGWFILGGHADLPIPRYDIRLMRNSPIFGVQDLSAALKQQGGVVVWRTGTLRPPTELGAPIVQWLDGGGSGVLVFCTVDVRDRVKP